MSLTIKQYKAIRLLQFIFLIMMLISLVNSFYLPAFAFGIISIIFYTFLKSLSQKTISTLRVLIVF